MKKLTQKHICMIPLALLFVIIPIMVKVKFFANPLTGYAWYATDDVLADFFLYYKSWLVTLTGAIMILMLCWQVSQMRRKDGLIGKDTRIFIPILIYLVLVVLSSLFSEYGYFPVHGMPDQFETVWNLIAYVVAVFYCYYVIFYHESENYLLTLIYIGAAIVGVICVLQFFKVDIYRLIYAGDGYSFTFEEGTVYGPFYNINYVGYYTLLFVPLFVLMLICVKDWKVRVASFVLAVLLLIAMIGAKSATAEIAFAAVAVFAVLFLLIKHARKKKLFWIPVAAIVLVGIAGLVVIAPRVSAYVQASNTERTNLENIFTNDDSVEIDYMGQKLFVAMYQTDDDLLVCQATDQDQNAVSIEYAVSEDGSYYYYNVADERFPGFTLTPTLLSEDPAIYGFLVGIDGKNWCFTNQIDDTGSYYYYTDIGTVTKLTTDTVSEDFAPLVNKSSLASGRGYIWNKTIAILKNYVLFGSGADTYALVYPNGDFVDKYNNGYDNMILTKPHNLYLQIGVQTGVLSLICFIVFYLWYFISSLRIYWKQPLNSVCAAAGFAIMLGTLGYMIAGVANDSTITVSPMFWALMGVGIALNQRLKKQTAE